MSTPTSSAPPPPPPPATSSSASSSATAATTYSSATTAPRILTRAILIKHNSGYDHVRKPVLRRWLDGELEAEAAPDEKPGT